MRIGPWLEEGDRLLDLGGGTGRISDWLREHRMVDPTVSDIQPRKHRARSLPTLIQDDPFHVPADDGSFDVVMLLFVLHHVATHEEQHQLLEEVVRLATRRVIVIEDTPGNPIELASNKVFDWVFNRPQGVPTPFTFRGPDAWEPEFARHGLRPVHRESYRPIWPQFKTYPNTLYVLDR